MRNAAELRAAAMSTGTYAAYAGDGATVPWQCSPPPIGMLLYVYKTYLDARWWEAFRLHDWLYTPYGALIHAERLECDLALREEIERDSPVDAAIVFLAVRLGGAPYFGVSQTGYVPGAMPGGTGNIADARGNNTRGDPSMGIKVVMVFQQVTTAGASAPEVGYAGRQHIGGWTEHVWFDGANVPILVSHLKTTIGGLSGLLPGRARCLPVSAQIIGVRLYQGGAGRGQFLAAAYPGEFVQADIPQMALLLKGQSRAGAARLFTMRSIPDSQVIGGEFSPGDDFRGALQNYIRALGYWSFLAATVGVPVLQVATITAGGLVSLMVANPYAIGAWVDFNRLIGADGRERSTRAQVTAIGPLATQFTVGNVSNPWTLGATFSGTVTQKTKTLYQFDSASTTVSRITTRRIGRPSELYRGRASNRRG